MKRSPLRRRTPLRRGKPLQRRVPIGAAARRRIRAGGVLAKGRPSATRAGWRALTALVRARSGGRCEFVMDNIRCHRRGEQKHHKRRRSQGGTDTAENLADPLGVKWRAVLIATALRWVAPA